jgi:hypothetical protein
MLYSNKMLRSNRKQNNKFKKSVTDNPIEIIYPISPTQMLHLGVGTHNLELILPFEEYLEKERFNESFLKLIKQQGLLRSVLVNQGGKMMWRQHAAPKTIHIPFLDLSSFSYTEQLKKLKIIILEKKLKKFPTHSWLYRCVVIKDILLMYFKKNVGVNNFIFQIISKITNLPFLLKRTCLRNSLLYRVLLIKRNLKEYQLVLRMDHIIGDDTSLEIIQNNLLDYYRSGKVEKSEMQVKPYHQYVELLKVGPLYISPEQLRKQWSCDEYIYYSRLVRQRIDRNKTKYVNLFLYEYALGESTFCSEERAWEISFLLVIVFCQLFFQLKKIPLRILYYGRRYDNQTFFNTVGEFWDLIPVLVEFDPEDPSRMITSVNERIEKSAVHNVNFVSMFLNDSLYKNWNGIIDAIAPARLTPPEPMIIVDFLGKRLNLNEGEVKDPSVKITIPASERKRLMKEKYVSIRSQGGFLIYIYYNSKKIFLRVESLVPVNEIQIKSQMDRSIEKMIENFKS